MTPANSAFRRTEADVRGIAWRTSSYSGNNNGCVEQGRIATGQRAVRDTKDRQRSTLVFDAAAWGAFVAAVRDGHLSA
ncbi:DUF397 domain-containing protein [Streptomyces sp. 4N509B]|uniref:DUF397 domain-containing protein n=1 Tax=Streptomyces sp. 4N509B TaxID=3457413 RepID=UPI003FD4146D